MNRKKFRKLTCLTLMFALLFSYASFAADSKISSVTLTITSYIEAGDDDSDVDVSTTSSHYYVDDVTIVNEPSGEWSSGAKPRIKVTLEASDGYAFSSSFSKSNVTIKGNDATVTSVSKGTYTATISITLEALDYYSDDYELDVDDMSWDEEYGTAYWEEAEDAKRYEVRLYRNGSSVTEILTTSDTYYDFAENFTSSGTYTFRVRGVYNSSNKGSWNESEELDVTSSEARAIRNTAGTSDSSSSSSSSSGSDSSGGWSGSGDTWYYYSNGSKVTGWLEISSDEWYFMDSNGLMLSGWYNDGTNFYYLNTDHDGTFGKMLTGTQTIEGVPHYFNEDHDGTYGRLIE